MTEISTSLEFEDFGKIARMNRGMVITEKLDGTNAQVHIRTIGDAPFDERFDTRIDTEARDEIFFVRAGSRNRWLGKTKETDNHGFGRWVADNAEELIKLDVGRHFGEWWGQGIQRGYGLTEKRFSLFNVARWDNEALRPACCHVVPTLYKGPFCTFVINDMVQDLPDVGSHAAPGFMRPEGVIVWHEAARQLFKITCDKDEAPKSLSQAA